MEHWSKRIDFKKIKKIIDFDSDKFLDLVDLCGLDPKADFCRIDLGGVNFGDSVLVGFDFSGSDLRGCNFSLAEFFECIFHGALVEGVIWPDGWFPVTENGVFISWEKGAELNKTRNLNFRRNSDVLDLTVELSAIYADLLKEKIEEMSQEDKKAINDFMYEKTMSRSIFSTSAFNVLIFLYKIWGQKPDSEEDLRGILEGFNVSRRSAPLSKGNLYMMLNSSESRAQINKYINFFMLAGFLVYGDKKVSGNIKMTDLGKEFIENICQKQKSEIRSYIDLR